MTYGEILAEIRMWVRKDSLTKEEYGRLASLTIAFCNGYNCKWSLDIMKTMNEVRDKGIEQMEMDNFDLPLRVSTAITSAKGNSM